MIRRLLIVSASALLLVSCSTVPSLRLEPSASRFSLLSGSAEEVSGDPQKGAHLSGISKTRDEDLLARASLYEADLDQALGAFDLALALSAGESLYSLLSASDSPAAAVRLESARARITAALESLSFEAVSVPPETTAGKAFKKDFAVRATRLIGGESAPAAGLSCMVWFPVRSPDGSIAMETRNLVTDEAGLCSFAAPVPERSAKGTLAIAASMGSRDPVVSDKIEALKRSGSLGAGFPYLVSASARSVPTTIAILDHDAAGKPVLSSNASATALLMPLVQKGFSRIGMADFPARLASESEETIVQAAKNQFAGAVRRYIFGTTRIESLEQNAEGLWTCSITASVAARDLLDGSELFRTTLSHTETAKTKSAALDAARKKLAGEILAGELIYSL